MSATPPAQPVQLNIELPADLEPTYANCALITHSPSEIIVDFSRLLPGAPKARVLARVIMTPMNAKSLVKALAENLEAFEKQHGAIKTPDASVAGDKPMGFGR